jgi:CheY-like chemotaxis protein
MAGFRLLLADDDEDDFFIISQAFEEFGRPYELQYVRNGKELLDRLNVIQVPDLIVLDINMPLVNGYEALEQIRSTSAYASVPVFVYSTSEDNGEKHKCMMLGANAFFTKAYTYKKVQSFVTDIDLFLNYPHRMPQPL